MEKKKEKKKKTDRAFSFSKIFLPPFFFFFFSFSSIDDDDDDDEVFIKLSGIPGRGYAIASTNYQSRIADDSTSCCLRGIVYLLYILGFLSTSGSSAPVAPTVTKGRSGGSINYQPFFDYGTGHRRGGGGNNP